MLVTDHIALTVDDANFTVRAYHAVLDVIAGTTGQRGFAGGSRAGAVAHIGWAGAVHPLVPGAEMGRGGEARGDGDLDMTGAPVLVFILDPSTRRFLLLSSPAKRGMSLGNVRNCICSQSEPAPSSV